MLTAQDILDLCQTPESSTLDFKAQFYDFQKDSDGRATASLVKDVISMINTVRDVTAYIIFGVEVAPGTQARLKGITFMIDDAILQDKVKSKVHPHPDFTFYTIDVQGVNIGVMEFPVRRYSSPISSTVKLKGVDAGKFYHRKGSANSEALGHDVIRMSQWMDSLPAINTSIDQTEDLKGLMVQIANQQIPLSQTFASMFTFAKRYSNRPLLDFCSRELQGISSGSVELSNGELDYRLQKLLVTYNQFTINRGHYSVSELKAELRKQQGVHEMNVMLNQSISELDTLINRFSTSSPNTIATMTVSSQVFLPELDADHPITVYLFPDDVSHVYSRIRQKAIDMLIL